MQHPFQCVAFLTADSIVAACGPRLLAYSLRSQEISAEWSTEEDFPEAGIAPQHDAEPERPAKKQKRNAVAKASNIIRLLVAEEIGHVVAVTDDKAFRVFDCKDGQLTELSHRVMPKRPCAIQIIEHDTTILCADKFGDVYSLPLRQPDDIPDDNAAQAQQNSPQPVTQFRPSASTLTVHSQRNRQALEAQMKQKNFTPRKNALTFEHKLLLGHVSMLTDMKYMRHPEDPRKAYIVTADRDEHIRVTRAPPQTHIIEGFCLGHKSFVSKICQVERTEFLVSGGGDSWLGVWDWPHFTIRNKVDLLTYVRQVPGHTNDEQIAVSGIWSMSVEANGGLSRVPLVLVACERIEALFCITLPALLASSAEAGQEQQTLVRIMQLPGCPLDITTRNENFLVALDVRNPEGAATRLCTFCPTKMGSLEDPTDLIDIKAGDLFGSEPSQVLSSLNRYSGPPDVPVKELETLLYSVTNLRKRGHLEEGGDDEDEEVTVEQGSDAGTNGAVME